MVFTKLGSRKKKSTATTEESSTVEKKQPEIEKPLKKKSNKSMIGISSIISILAAVAPTIAGLFTSGGKSSTLIGKGLEILGDLLNKPGASPAEIERDLYYLATYKEVELKRIENEFAIAMKGMDLEFTLTLQMAGLELAKEQAKINALDAKSKDKFRNRWRPTLMWGGIIGILFALALKFFVPAVLIVLTLFGITEDPTTEAIKEILASLDTGFLLQIMVPLLGIGYMTRGYEKVRGEK